MIYFVCANEHSVNAFEQICATPMPRNGYVGTFFCYGNVIYYTADGTNLFGYNVKWNRSKFVEASTIFHNPEDQRAIKAFASNEFDNKDVPGHMLEAVLLGLKNKVEGDEFEKAFKALFECELTHKVTMNFITQGYLFQAKSELGKFNLPSDIPIENTVTSFLVNEMNLFHMMKS